MRNSARDTKVSRKEKQMFQPLEIRFVLLWKKLKVMEMIPFSTNLKIYVNTENTIPNYTRGIFLVVNGRVIEKNLYSEIFPELTSPASISARVRGYIEANYLEKAIQANREDFFDNKTVNEIKERLKEPIQQIINDYIQQRRTEEKEQQYNELLQRIENAKNKFSAPNKNLKSIGLNFNLHSLDVPSYAYTLLSR